jgi:NADP-dependent 3-hydroxy acid dehydrogenase YdfG
MILKNKTILITGASKGIGRALALMLAAEGCNLGLVARSQAELEQLKTEIEQIGAKVLIFVSDVGDKVAAQNAVNTVQNTFGNIYSVVNNAGFGIFKQAENIDAEEWDAVMDTNVKGTFLYSKLAIPYMREQGEGHIINIASDIAKRVFAGGSLYCASKYAQDAFSMALRKEVRQFGIKVSVVYSGLVDTHFHTHAQGDPKADSWLKDRDVADAIFYILTAPKHVVIDELMLHPLSQDY